MLLLKATGLHAVCAAGIEAVAPDGEKYTKLKGKERPTEAPLPF